MLIYTTAHFQFFDPVFCGASLLGELDMDFRAAGWVGLASTCRANSDGIGLA